MSNYARNLYSILFAFAKTRRDNRRRLNKKKKIKNGNQGLRLWLAISAHRRHFVCQANEEGKGARKANAGNYRTLCCIRLTPGIP